MLSSESRTAPGLFDSNSAFSHQMHQHLFQADHDSNTFDFQHESDVYQIVDPFYQYL